MPMYGVGRLLECHWVLPTSWLELELLIVALDAPNGTPLPLTRFRRWDSGDECTLSCRSLVYVQVNCLLEQVMQGCWPLH